MHKSVGDINTSKLDIPVFQGPSETLQRAPLPRKSLYERIVYTLDILIPEHENEYITVPAESYLQKVILGENQWQWRIVKNKDVKMIPYLVDHREPRTTYRIMHEKKTTLPLFDSTSKFLRRWDALALILLLFTASVTPYETAFLASDGAPHIDLLFIINQCVDLVFAMDMFIQFRTPYRDDETGQLIREPMTIASRYLKGWFFVDLISTLPFDLLGFMQSDENSASLSELRIIRLIRLLRLLKLLRILRASRKSRQLQVYLNFRYATWQFIQTAVFIIFVIHWIACGYRIAAQKTFSTDPDGWVDHYMDYRGHSVSVSEIYLAALYWSSGVISLVAPTFEGIAPSNIREYGYAIFAQFVAYMNAILCIATLTHVFSISGKFQRTHDFEVDQYLEMFTKLKLDLALKLKVHNYLSEHHALASAAEYSSMLKRLPAQLHGFISREVFTHFISLVPFLQIFIDREPILMQELCRQVEIRNYAANSHVYTEGYEGIYYIDRGVVAIEGVVYLSGSVFGKSVLRQTIKNDECRALTTVTIHFLDRAKLIEILRKYPKIRYYAKRWTAWEVLRKYIFQYSKLYYIAAKRGSELIPPLLSRRGEMKNDEVDDIDYAVINYITETGF